MPPRRNKQTRLAVQVEPRTEPSVTVETLPQLTQVRQRGRPQHVAPGGESFDLANISGSENEEEEQHPAQPPIGPYTTIPDNNGNINNPDVVTRKSKNQAGDVHFFFNKSAECYQCKFCK
jgi:hypothetical protein